MLRTWDADQAPSKTVAFFRIPSQTFMSGTWSFKIIERNIKAIFREYISSLREDSGKIFKLMTFRRGPRTTYCIGNSMICSDISKLLYVISRADRRLKFETILKYHVQIMLLFVYTTTRRRFVIFTCRCFKLRWNTTALSQSNYRNFSCSSITRRILILLKKSIERFHEIIR